MKIKELGITSGCGNGTTYCPDNSMTYGSLAVFAARAMAVAAASPIQAQPDPQPCDPRTSPYYDVSPSDSFCPFIQIMKNQLGPLAVKPGCSPGYFCENDSPTRGVMAFYLVEGVMKQTSLSSSYLPTNGVGLPPVVDTSYPNVPGLCPSGWKLVTANGLTAVPSSQGMLIHAVGGTAVGTDNGQAGLNPDAWHLRVDFKVLKSGATLYSGHQEAFDLFSPNGGYVPSQDFQFDPNGLYHGTADHSWFSPCVGGLYIASTINEPAAFTASPSVLYRGTTQDIVIKGSSLGGTFVSEPTYGVYLISNNATYPASATVLSSSEFQTILRVNIPPGVPSGQSTLKFFAHSPNSSPLITFGDSFLSVDGFTVGDPTPGLYSITPSPGTQGESKTTTLSGSNFGANPQVCINDICSNGGVVTVNGFTITHPTSCTAPCNSLTATFDMINAAAATYSIRIRSNGMASWSGFQSIGGSQALSIPVSFMLQPACPSSVSLVVYPFIRTGPLSYRAIFAATGLQPGGTYSWSTSDTTVATISNVSSTGEADVNSVSHGTVTITVQYTSPCGGISYASKIYRRTREVSVMGYADANKIQQDWQSNTLKDQVSPSLESILGTTLGCSAATLSWWTAGSTGTNAAAIPAVDTEADRRFANYTVVLNSANAGMNAPSDSYTSLDVAYAQSNQFRLFQTALAIWEVNSQGVRQGPAQLLNSKTTVGLTLEPCTGANLTWFSPSGEVHAGGFDGRAGVDTNLLIYQVNEVRVGSTGQGINRYLNHRDYPDAQSTVPWAHSTIQFDQNGNMVPLMVQQNGTSFNISRFPSFRTYYSVPSGIVFQQSVLELDVQGFIDLDSDYYYRVP